MKALRSTQRVRENSDSIPVLKKFTFRWGKMDIYTSNYIRGPPKFQYETILILAQVRKMSPWKVEGSRCLAGVDTDDF